MNVPLSLLQAAEWDIHLECGGFAVDELPGLGYFKVVRRYAWVALSAPVFALLAVAAPVGHPGAGAATAAPDRTRIARLVPDVEGGLGGVAALSASNAWAVGSDANNPLILHWNGKAWRRVAAPRPCSQRLTASGTSRARADGGADKKGDGSQFADDGRGLLS
jgi:hypothetical protein